MTRNVIVHGDSRTHIPKITTPINCVITDPPYGMDFQSNFAKTPDGKKNTKKIENDGDLVQALNLFESVMAAIIPKLAPQADLYVFTAWHIIDTWLPFLRTLSPELTVKQMIVWEKGWPGLGDLEGNWGCGHELIVYMKKGRRPVQKRRSAVIHTDKPVPGKQIHPTEKPVGLLRELVEMSTSPGDLIVDPFSGSGSTSVAAMELGRNSLAFEIDEKYIEPSRSRLKVQGLF